MTTLEWERQILNSMDLNDPRILEQSKKVDKLIMEEFKIVEGRQLSLLGGDINGMENHAGGR